MCFPYLRQAAPDVLATARAQRRDPAEVLRILLETEIKGRDEATRRNHRKQANLPTGKTFDSWKETDSSIPLPTQHALTTLEWIGRAENLALPGPSGTGKSHFAEAIAHQAVDAGLQVCWFTLESLTASLGRAAVDNSVARAVAKITRCDLIVVDDIGMLPCGQAAAEAFYRVIDAAYERRSVIVTSNLRPSGFDSIMPKTLATQPSTGSCTTPTSSSPKAPVSASRRPPPARASSHWHRASRTSCEHSQPRKTCHVVAEASSRVAQWFRGSAGKLASEGSLSSRCAAWSSRGRPIHRGSTAANACQSPSSARQTLTTACPRRTRFDTNTGSSGSSEYSGPQSSCDSTFTTSSWAGEDPSQHTPTRPPHPGRSAVKAIH